MQLGSAETYKILGQGGCITLDGVDDAKQFKGVQRAFDTIGMDKDSQMEVRSTLPSAARPLFGMRTYVTLPL